MLNQYVNKKSEFELLDLLDKKQSLQIAIEDLEAAAGIPWTPRGYDGRRP